MKNAAEAAETKPNDDANVLRDVVKTLLTELRDGSGDKDKRRQVEDWMKSLTDKYPDFDIDAGLRTYYLAEAARLREDFEKAADLGERLTLGRSIEGFLEKANEAGRRLSEQK